MTDDHSVGGRDAEEKGPASNAVTSGDQSDRRNAVVGFAVEHKVTMFMVVLGLVVLGTISLQRLPLDFLPSFESSSLSVNVPYPSSSPDEVERLIVRPLEDAVSTIPGISRLTSSASDSSANLNVEFVTGTDMELAAVEVRDRLDRARERLPNDVENVFVRRFQSSDIPVLRSSIAAPWPQEELYDWIENTLQPRLERIEGVAQVRVSGIRSKQLQVQLIPARMQAAGLDARQVAAALRGNHLNVSAGALDEGNRRFLVRSVGEMQSVEEFRRLPLRADGLKLGDVADVIFDFPRRTDFSYLNGEEAVDISVNKASTANLLAVVELVKEEYAGALNSAGRGLTVRHFHDASEDVTKGLRELARAGLVGGGLAILFTFFFLRKFRTTLLVALAIPLSLLATFVIIYLGRQAGWTDLTLNVISLTGLMLAMGMLLDNSIVVIESIFRHRQDLGADARTAAIRGASEVALPILASTATTVCVFVPLVFLGGGSSGGFSRFMTDIGTTVCVVIIGSLLVALTIVPMMAALLLRSEARKRSKGLEKAIAFYGRVLRLTLRHRLIFAGLIVLLLVWSWRMFNNIERSIGTPSQSRQFTMFVDVPPRYSPEQRTALFSELAGLLESHREEWEIADVRYDYRTSGGRSRGGYFGSNRFNVYLTPEEESKLKVGEISERIRAALPQKAGIGFTVKQAQHGPGGGGDSVELELIGDDLGTLGRLADLAVGRLAELPMLRDIDTSLESGDDEVRVVVDRERAAKHGLTTRFVAQAVSSALSSRALDYFETNDREVPLVLLYRERDRETLAQLGQVPVALPGGDAVALSTLVDFQLTRGAARIEREDRRAKVTVSANVTAGMPSFAALGMVRRSLADFGLPEGYEMRFGRSFRDAQQEEAGSQFALIMAIALIYMIMASLFEDFLQPFVIVMSIPFAFIGVGLIMKLVGQPRSDASSMGLIILAGIVVNNAIVLVDHINHLRQQGIPRDTAVVLGGQHRMRPILLTAMTTILGLFPMVAPYFFPGIFGQLEGRAAFWAPVGLVILGGLTTSTALTLLVIPTFYTLVDDFKTFLQRFAGSVRQGTRSKVAVLQGPVEVD